MKSVPVGNCLVVSVAGRIRIFDKANDGFSAALRWAADVIGALLLTFFLIIAVAAAEAL